MPTPQSSWFNTNELSHPNGCKSQLRSLSQRTKPTRTVRFINVFMGNNGVVIGCEHDMVCLVTFCHNSTTSLSYWETCIWACCSQQGEPSTGFPMNLARVKHRKKNTNYLELAMWNL
jgi:hypothetical protein